MRKGERRLFLAVLAILLLALILLFTQWASGGNTPKIYHVSVLLDGADGDYWKNFRAGMNQAALEKNVDLRFITKYDGTTQESALRGEWEGEADGVVIIPADASALSETLKDAPTGLVVGVVGPELSSDRVNCYVSPDYTAMARALADAASTRAGCTLYLSPDAPPSALLLADSVEAYLLEKGVPCYRNTSKPEDVTSVAVAGALVAVEPVMTEALCAAMGAGGRVYGVGVSSRLLHYLEDGTAAALVVQSDYDAGYLSVLQVARRLARENTENAVLETYTATGENMFEEPIINILFATY